MTRHFRGAKTWSLSPLLLAGSLLAASGCSQSKAPNSGEPQEPNTQARAAEAPQEGELEPLEKLPFSEPEASAQVFMQQLSKPTALGENMAVHVRLPAPANKELEGSLVRVIGTREDPQLLFRSDALAELGAIPKSPGSEFFTLFTQHDAKEFERRLESEKRLSSGEFGEVSSQSIVFQGRTPVSLTRALPLDLGGVISGDPTPVTNSCPSIPASTLQKWGESLFITSPAVVLNPERTWDPCTGAGTQGGAWTFAHLMREMAQGSGTTPENFVLEWLKLWVNNQTVNGDVVAARTAMFSQVIEPWATASGVSAFMVYSPSTGRNEVFLTGPLNLNIAPFRLLAIVNRLDLGGTTTGPSGYGGRVSSQPTDAGELRFIFGVVQPNPWGAGSQKTCGLKPFTVIFEYGVPITGCGKVAAWAREWTRLNTYGGFNASYLAHLQSLTESVVLHGKAPGKGNQNAINQIRTNENALNSRWWELREFRLAKETPGQADTPVSGLLRQHTVAQSPNDSAFSAFGDATIDSFVLNDVLNGTPTTSSLPNNCSSTFNVPHIYGSSYFRGGNALIDPSFWRVNIDPWDTTQACARHQFSLNTCQGCHHGDTRTYFTHIDPMAGIPAPLSGFLTGGGPGLSFGVPDPQLGSPTWRYADLQQRWQRLYDIAHCVQCSRVPRFDPVRFDEVFISDIGVLPIDPIGPIEDSPIKVGPVRDIGQVKLLLERRAEFVKEFRDEPVSFIQPAQTAVH
ncbi:hypothetical protein F0U61_30985 [Archangium violaceum]|uniref:hypothetical protein n=1 Tax=Archangium violaceum TaxID=83451 RepID=UPI002B2F9E36|nr:hypothetical protein F0U61_30985 [Archangium violaceum]